MRLREFSGTPWHKERYSREEGDDKRHRSKCIYFRKCDKYCIERFETCIGSAHCPNYKVKCEKTCDSNDLLTLSKQTKKITSGKKSEPKDKFPVNSKVKHSKFGIGIVKEISNEKVTIIFENGPTMKFNLDICLDGKLLKRI